MQKTNAPTGESPLRRFLRVARGELIGLPVNVVESTDPTLVGTKGVVIDESLNTFLVERDDDQRQVLIAKSNNVFAFEDDEGGEPVRIPGERIQFRPEDRIKRVR